MQVDFAVHKRARPADYVYTPTEHAGFDRLRAEIGDLADLTTEAKDTLVAAINEVARTGGGAGSMDLRVADGYIQYSTDGGSTWTNLIAVADLKGDTGATGPAGPQGPAGAPGKDGAGMGITGATVGQIAKITAVDASGVPTAWSPVDMPSGGGGETNFQLVFNQECLLDADVSAYEVDIGFGLQDFKEIIALIEYSASTNDVYQSTIIFDGVTIDNYGGPTLKGSVLRRIIYAERTTQAEYMSIHRAHSLNFDWPGGNTPSTLSYFSGRIRSPTGKFRIWRSNSAEATTITVKLYKR